MERRFLFICYITLCYRVTNAITLTLYTEEGSTTRLKCPVTEIHAGDVNITNVRWTLESVTPTFIAQWYDNAPPTIHNERISISDASPTTLVIKDVRIPDGGKYRCRVGYRGDVTSRPIGHIRLKVYVSPFVLKLDISQSGGCQNDNAEEMPVLVNVREESTLTVNCSASLTSNAVMVNLTFNGTNLSTFLYGNESISDDVHGDDYTTIGSFTIGETHKDDSGIYSCVAYNENSTQIGKGCNFLLRVQDRSVQLATTSTGYVTTSDTVSAYSVHSSSGPMLMRGMKANIETGISSSASSDDMFTHIADVLPTEVGSKNVTPLIIMLVIVLLVIVIAVISVVAIAQRRRKRSNFKSKYTAREQYHDSAYVELYKFSGSEKIKVKPFLNDTHRDTTPKERSPYIHALKMVQLKQEEAPSCRAASIRKNAKELNYSLLQFSDGYLGRGEFGVVRKAFVLDDERTQGNKEVAVKCLQENASKEERNNLLRELEIMKLLQEKHPNVITLYGYCTLSGPLCIIVEFAPNGNLEIYLVKNRPNEMFQNHHPCGRYLTAFDLLQFMWQTAQGMSYIASKRIIHRDLAARNVLLGEDRCCKISDFGLARDISETDIYETKSTGPLPIRWMALESLLRSTYTTKSDVWSYGVLLWEIATLGGTPYPELNTTDVIRKLHKGYRLPKPRHCSEELYQVMLECWDLRPERRPSFPDLCCSLEDMANNTTKECLSLKAFDAHVYANLSEEDNQSDFSLKNFEDL